MRQILFRFFFFVSIAAAGSVGPVNAAQNTVKDTAYLSSLGINIPFGDESVKPRISEFAGFLIRGAKLSAETRDILLGQRFSITVAGEEIVLPMAVLIFAREGNSVGNLSQIVEDIKRNVRVEKVEYVQQSVSSPQPPK